MTLTSMIYKIILFIVFLPFGPFVSIIFWIDKHGWMQNAFRLFDLTPLGKRRMNKGDSYSEWMDKKMETHIGFLIESTLEAIVK